MSRARSSVLGVVTSVNRVNRRPCAVEGCQRLEANRGICHAHYEWKRKRGLLSDHPLPRKPDLFDRLTDKLIAPSGSECWEWQGTRHNRGYGNFAISEGGKTRTTFAHRVAAHLWLGMELFAPKSVCHRCDNPPCCNPAHLYVGTQTENVHDALAKGRVKHYRKVTLEQREEIRKRRACGERYKEIAKDYGITWHHCWIICNGRKTDSHHDYQAIQ